MNKRFSINTEDDKILGYISDIEGLNGNYKIIINNEVYNKLILKCCIPFDKLKKWYLGEYDWKYEKAINANINILNYQNKIIGSYYIDTFLPIKYETLDIDAADITIAGNLNNTLSDTLIEIWEKFRIRLPQNKNEWVRLETEEKRKAWLEVVRLYPKKYIKERDRGSVIDIDGTYINDNSSFFCAIGEAVNGPAGYFGFSLDSFDDCLCGGFGVSVPFILRWKNFCKKNNLNINKEIFNILLQRGVNIVKL